MVGAAVFGSCRMLSGFIAVSCFAFAGVRRLTGPSCLEADRVCNEVLAFPIAIGAARALAGFACPVDFAGPVDCNDDFADFFTTSLFFGFLVTAHPMPYETDATAAPTARASVMAANAVRPLRRPVATIEQISA